MPLPPVRVLAGPAAVALAACTPVASMIDAEPTPPGPAVTVAHRGAWKAGGLPENSLASLRAAVALGCAGSEFDVRMSADDTLVVAHDPTHAGLAIEATPYAALAAEPLANGEPLPTLRAYLEEGVRQNDGPGPPTRLLLEVKASPAGPTRSAEIARRAVALARETGAAPLTDYISFSYDALLAVRAADSTAHTQYLEGDRPPDALVADGIGGLDYQYLVYRANAAWIQEAHDLGLRLNAWTVDAEGDMRWLLERGFDLITTDEPERLIGLTPEG